MTPSKQLPPAIDVELEALFRCIDSTTAQTQARRDFVSQSIDRHREDWEKSLVDDLCAEFAELTDLLGALRRCRSELNEVREVAP